MNPSKSSLYSRLVLAFGTGRGASAPRAPRRTSLLADTLGAAAAAVSVCALVGAILAAAI